MSKSSDVLRGEKLELVERAEALASVIDGGEATEEQRGEFNALTADDGPIAEKTEQIRAAESYELRLKALQEERASILASSRPKWVGMQPQAAERNEPAKAPAIVSLGSSRHFADERTAYAAGNWIKGIATDSREERERCFSEMSRIGGEYWNEYASQVIGTGSKGGYLIPTPIVGAILKYRDSIGIASQVANTIGVTTEKVFVNEQVSGPTVYYLDEEQEITASDVTYRQHELTIRKVGALTKVSSEMMADSPTSVAGEVVEDMGYRFSYARDNELLNGDGTATYGRVTGLISAAGAAGVSTAATGRDTLEELTLDEFYGAARKVADKFKGGNLAWIMSHECWESAVTRLALAAGGNTSANLQEGITNRQWGGYPVFLTSLLPTTAASTTYALFGNFRAAVTLADRNDMTIATSSERDFENDRILIRGTNRYGIRVTHAATASVKGAYAVLKTAA